MKSRFITVEGSDGSGKSTLLLRLQSYVQNRGVNCLFTREPGGTELGEQIRDLILSRPMTSLTELFLYEAARAEHVAQVILPALKSGKFVFCDRFTHSTLAYQGAARGLPIKLIEQLNRVATLGLKPDAVIWLKLSPNEAEKRRDTRGGHTRLDSERKSFHLSVHRSFTAMAKQKQFIVLNASRSPDEIFDELISHPLWKKFFGELS